MHILRFLVLSISLYFCGVSPSVTHFDQSIPFERFLSFKDINDQVVFKKKTLKSEEQQKRSAEEQNSKLKCNRVEQIRK